MPILLLILLMPIVEIYVLVRVGAAVGIVNTIFALLAIGVLGAGLARTQGRFIVQKIQASLARGQVPANQALHGVLVFLAGILFLIPGFVSDVVALVFLLPGTRHLLVRLISNKLRRGMSRGSFRVYTNGAGFGGFGGFGRQPGTPPQNPFSHDTGARDVTPKVIDITPISSHTKTNDNDDN